VTGGALQRIFFASLAVLGADGIIRAKREALRRSRKSSNASFICGIVLRTSRKFGKVRMLSIVVLFGDEALGDRQETQRVFVLGKKKQARIAVGKPLFLGLVRARYGPEIVNRLR
jgi:hypothetical protein